MFLFVLLASCSTDSNQPYDKKEHKVFKATINQKEFFFTDNFSSNPSSPYHTNYALTASIYNNSKLIIKAKDSASHQSISLVIGNAFAGEPLKEGTYKIGQPNGEYPITNIYYDNEDILGDNDEYYFNKNFGCHLTGNQLVGKIVISKIDRTNNRIKGSFNGTLFGWVRKPDEIEFIGTNVEITNGKFDLPYKSIDDIEKDSNIDKGDFQVRVKHKDRDFTFSPTDGLLTGVGTRHFRVSLGLNDTGSPKTLNMLIENENFGVIKIKVENSTEIEIGVTYNFSTDLTKNFLNHTHYLYFHDFYYNTNYTTSPLPLEKNNFHFTLLSINKEEKIIEGKFDVYNSARGVSMTDGYFKVKYN